MQPEAYHRLAAREDTYWWYRARRRLSVGLLQRFGAKSGARVIDIGCGSGGSLVLFAELAPALVVGLDLSPVALCHAQRKMPGASFVRSDVSRDLPFSDGSFDIATMFNVLYHGWVRDDRVVLGGIARLLRPGGLLLVTEPAFAMLRRSLDRVVMGRRRYTIGRLRQLAAAAGFDVIFASYFSSLAFPIALAAAALDRLRALAAKQASDNFASIDFKSINVGLNEALFRLAAKEAAAIVRGCSIPVGVGLVAVLRRAAAAP